VKIVTEATEIAKIFMNDSLKVRLIGMNSEMMGDYIEYISDRLVVMLGYKKIYNKQNPFGFMKTIGLDDKTNFFEVRPTEYQDSYILNRSKDKKIVINDDF
jgi:ribonucleotide reductase beta subunit family protein with ferritin-like domain